MPRSVMMPATYRCGVTSNAGFQTLALGRQRVVPRVRDLAGIALLDGNPIAVRRLQIDRGERRRDVNGTACAWASGATV
jgi:hypothetical protein